MDVSEPNVAEDLYFRALATHGLDGAEPLDSSEPPDDLMWRRIFGRVTTGRISGVATSAVINGAVPITDAQASELGDYHAAAMAWALGVEIETVRVVDALDAAGVAHLALKGVALARQLYEDPMLRQFADIDLLIPGDQIDLAVATLTDIGISRRLPQLRPGYDARFAKGVDMIASSDVEVDVHRSLAMGWFGKRMTPTDMFASATTVDLAGRRLACPSLEDSLVHAAVHAVLGSAEMRASNMRDIAELCQFEPLDHDSVIGRASDWECGLVLAVALERVADAWDVDLGDLLAWARGYEPGAGERRRLVDYRRDEGKIDDILLGQIGAVDGIASKARFVASVTLPCRANLTARGLTRTSHLRQVTRGARAVATKRLRSSR